MKFLSIMPCRLEILSVGKDTSGKTLQPCWKGPYQVPLTIPCATKLQGADSWIHVTCKESTKPPLDLHSIWWPGFEAHNIRRDHFAKISRPGLLEVSRFTEVSLFYLDHRMTLDSYPNSWFLNFFVRLNHG